MYKFLCNPCPHSSKYCNELADIDEAHATKNLAASLFAIVYSCNGGKASANQTLTTPTTATITMTTATLVSLVR